MNTLRISLSFKNTRGLLLLVSFFLVGCGQAILTPPPPTATARPGRSPTPQPTASIAPGSFLTPIPATPTFTPVPTPTPVIHIVEQGDTLFGIALEYGVTLDAILTLNGIDDNDFLRIGQAIIIPTEELEDESGTGMAVPVGNMILPTPTPLPLSVGEVALYHTPAGGLWAMGEVHNTATGPVTNLQVQIVLVAADDTPLLAHVTLAAADYLPAGESAPFAVLFSQPPVGTEAAQSALLRGESISDITDSFVPLEVTETDGAISGPQYKVSGVLVNNNDAAVQRLSVVVTLYDAEQHVIGYRQRIWDETVLGIGQSQTFEILLTPQGLDTPAAYQVIAWAIIP